MRKQAPFFISLLALCALSVSGCSGSPSTSLVEKHMPESKRTAFTLCGHYGCTAQWRVGINDAEWDRVRAHFATPAPNAAAERVQIADAIGEIERIIGPKTGTDRDKPGATIIAGSTRGQQDCIDEAHNTTLYMYFMDRDGLLKWHDVGQPIKRGYVIDRWFHNTATVVEKDTGAVWAIDSWFGANGEPADVVDAAAWMDGWEPEKFKTRPDR